MANVQRGEVPLTVGDRVFTLVIDFEARVHVEELMSPSPDEVVSAYQVFLQIWGRKFPPFKHTRAAVLAALRNKHPEMTLKSVGELIDEAGGTNHFVEPLAAAYMASMPDKEDVQGRPREARQPSTGGPTTSTRGASRSRKKGSGG